MRAKNALTVTALLLVVGASAVACGAEGRPEPPYVGAGEVCGGVFAGPLEETVESVVGAASFDRSDTKGMDRVVEALRDGHASGRSWSSRKELCEMSPEGVNPRNVARISFWNYAPRDVGDPNLDSGGRLFAVGKEATAGRASASLYFECSSPLLKGSRERPARIAGALGAGKDRGAEVEYLAANLTVLHAASLAVAKELECENNAGLPEKLDPDLQPLP
ncbi:MULTISPECIES: hypothetical protein [unclassified Streptomyces]|uniref:hypothetical protein n=1 Tax=unclassified Streptomyces TaxID=2593676 RepID=UPI00093CADC2|nr:hypothetical protein [Streptomyces sp. TSRI0281]